MLVHPQFDPVAIAIGPIAVRWYGLMYLLAFALVVVLGKLRAPQHPLSGWHPRDIDDMLWYGIFGVILGGRLGYVLFYKPAYYLQHPAEILQLWSGGMSFHGGFLGVLVAMWIYARRRDKPWLAVTDFILDQVANNSAPQGEATGGVASRAMIKEGLLSPLAMLVKQLDRQVEDQDMKNAEHYERGLLTVDYMFQ